MAPCRNILVYLIRRCIAYILLIWLFISPFIIEPCLALYEDQVGKFDWRQQYIGAVRFVHFDYSSTGRKIIVASDQNVLAAINPSTSQIVWRQLLEPGAIGTIHALAGTTEIICVTGIEVLVRSWDPATGRLNWETSLSAGRAEQDSADRVDAAFYSVNIKEQTVTVVEGVYSAFIKLRKHNFHTGKVISWMQISAPWFDENLSCSIISSLHFVCVSIRMDTLYHLVLDGASAFSQTLLSKLGLAGTSANVKIVPLLHGDSNGQHLLAVQFGTTRFALLKANRQPPAPGASAIEIIKIFDQVSSICAAQNEEDTYVFVLSSSSSSLSETYETNLKVFSVSSNTYVDNMESVLTYSDYHGRPDKLFTRVVPRKDGGYGYRLLLRTEAHSLMLMQHPGKIVWIREEALASTLSIEMVDLPVSESDAQVEEQFDNVNANVLTMFGKRLATQAYQLQNFVTQLLLGLHSDVTGSLTPVEKTKLVRDEFNIHKVAVLVTANGKVYGMDSLNGAILWQRFLPEMAPLVRYGMQKLPLYVLRTTAHFPHQPQCAILALNKRTHRSLLFFFNPITGEPVGDSSNGVVQLEYRVIQAMQLPQPSTDFLRGLVLLDEQYKLHICPDSTRDVALRLAPFLYLFVADADTGVLRGFSLQFSTRTNLIAGQVWSLTFPTSGHVITNVVMKRSIEHVHSQGRVMGDRSVLYKYLNPNLAVVTTEDRNAAHKSPSLSIYLLDVVSGQIIFSAIHKRARGPIHVIHSENWIMYVFNNEKSRRMETVVLELYEGKVQSNTTAFSSLCPPPSPMIERQAYILPSMVDAVTVTITDKGITSKHLLFALPMGGILEIPKSFLDPRRSLFPSQELREEGIMPYNPELPTPTENIINYNQSVHRIRDIYTSPTGLESTLLVLAYGLDVFYTRVTPSRTFDILKDDFDHWLIVAVLSALIIASYVTKVLASKKALKQSWK